MAPSRPSSYYRVFSQRRWSLRRLCRALAGYTLTRWVPTGIVALPGGDTVVKHRGTKVYGKACHRDPVHSTQSYTAYRWGRRRVVLSILVQFPFPTRPWELPILVALYHNQEWNQKHGLRHKTLCTLVRQLLIVLLRWFPERRFRFAADGAFATHELAAFAQRWQERLILVSEFYPDANLYAPPERRGKKSMRRPRCKRGEAAQAGGYRCPHAAPAATQRGLVWRLPRHRSRQRYGVLVQSETQPCAGTLVLSARSYRCPPQRVIVHDGSETQRAPGCRETHGPLEYRDHV